MTAPLFKASGFKELWIAGGIANAMLWLEVLAAGLFTFQATRSGLAVAIVSAARSFPLLLAGAFIGVLSEAVNRKRIVVGGLVLTALSSVSVGALGLCGVLQTWHVGVAALISGLVYATEMPARRRMISECAGDEARPRAIAVDSMTNYATRCAGPLLGGFAYQRLGRVQLKPEAASKLGSDIFVTSLAISEAVMRMIIEARIDDGVGGGEAMRLAEFERLDGDLNQLGLNLAEGRDLVHEAQRALVCAQTRFVVSASLNCPHCGRTLSIKAIHAIRYRTVFGKVTIDSPQLRVCKCVQDQSAKSFSPLALALSLRVSPELEHLQVKWAAHLPYAVATTLLKEVLPVDQTISTSGLRNRVLMVGQKLDDHAESAIRGERDYPPADSNVKITALAVDSAWLRHRPSRKEKDEAKRWQYFPSKRPPSAGRHVNIIAGRAVREDGRCKVYGYVNREVTSAATRLDHFLSEQGVANDQKITIVSDGAGEFEKAVDGSKRPLIRILDWFHIAMKFRAIEQSAQKFPDLLAPNGHSLQDEIASAKWLTWHGKGSDAVEKLKRIHHMFGLVPEDSAHMALWWNLRGTYWYLEINGKYLVNYGWRYRRGMPISSSIAESAVNEVVSLRFAKKRQMRWTNKGAHLLVQVRVAVLNGDLEMREMPEPLQFYAERKRDDRGQRVA